MSFDKRVGILTGLGIGAGLMYLFDPNQGRRRRALVQDKATRAARKTRDAIEVLSKDLRNRGQGLIAEARGWRHAEQVDDETLAARVRSRLGRAARHLGSLTVTAKNGVITLRGPVLADEVPGVLRRTESVRGVRAVENQLEVHQRPENIPGLQGKATPHPGDIKKRPTVWSPTSRFLAAIAAGGLCIYGVGRRGPAGTAFTALGIGLLVRSLTNLDLARLVGVGRSNRALDINKTITVHAPIERVFEFWKHVENFPHIMRNVRAVRKIDENRSHWTVAGPAGIPIEWDALVTECIPCESISWTTVPGGLIEHGGTVRFRSNPDGSTTVYVMLSYDPVAGRLGNTLAGLFGADPETEIDEGLADLKTLLESHARESSGQSSAIGRP
jgi:uncharacterized membrane protein/osmotically-inducible protein OsmY